MHDQWLTRKQRLKATAPESCEYFLLKSRKESGNLDAMERALQLRPDSPVVYYDLLVNYEL